MKQVVNSFFGYRDPKPNEDYTDVILTKDEYNKNVVDKIENLQNEIKRLNKEHEKTIKDKESAANKKIDDVKAQAEKQVNEAKAETDKHKNRADSFENINKNLIRIATERANAKRGLIPKKGHISYVFLSIEEFVFNCECSFSNSNKTEILKFPCFRFRLQSPYEVSFDLNSAKDLIYSDLLNKLCEEIGVSSVYKNGIVGYTQNVVNEIWNRDGNFIFKTVYKANFQKGFWEVEYLSRDMVNTPTEMMAIK